MPGTTVVGYDGSEIAGAALQCAARRAGPAGRILVAHAVSVPSQFLGTAYHGGALEHARQRADRVQSEAEHALPDGVAGETRVVEGPPARALVELAQEVDAREIAVGSRGFGSLRGAALGSTSHARCTKPTGPC